MTNWKAIQAPPMRDVRPRYLSMGSWKRAGVKSGSSGKGKK